MLLRRSLNPAVSRLTRERAAAIALLAIGSMMLLTGTAHPADLTDSDYRYLADKYGLKREGNFLQNLGGDEKARLHATIDDPLYRATPIGRDSNVADVLFQLELRTCDGKPKTPDEVCPQQAGALPGQKVAQDHCFACHLTGTGEARSFYKLSQDGTWNEERLDAALASGHRMSPITLSPDELHRLADYIRSLK
jgi:hypothetical protein